MADRIVIGVNGRKYITQEPAPHKGEEYMSIHAIKVWFDGDKLVAQEIPEEKIYNQEPVAWMYTSQYKGNESYITRYQTDLTTYKAVDVWPLYTTPLQRLWVGLTMTDMAKLRMNGLHTISDKHFKTIEETLREKNNR
jgi:hypothetical protein